MKDMEKNLSIENALILNLRDLGHMVRSLYEGKGSQKRILILLRESGGLTQAERTQLPGGRLGSACVGMRKLVLAGLIHRTRNATDKRTVDICLTQSGKEAAESAALQRKQRHKDMFSCLTEQEKEELLCLTIKLNRDWEQRYSNHKQEGKY